MRFSLPVQIKSFRTKFRAKRFQAKRLHLENLQAKRLGTERLQEESLSAERLQTESLNALQTVSAASLFQVFHRKNITKALLATLISLLLVCSLSVAPLSAWADNAREEATQQGTQGEGSSDDQASTQSADGQSDSENQDNGDAQDSGNDLDNKIYVNQLSDSSFLYETSIADLAEADSYYEGQTVLVKGEVVGDRVNDEFRSDTCWITLQDDEENPSIVAVFMTKDQSSIIDTYGQYGQVGTQLQVRGTYHLECAEHQGMSDIHAEEVSALQEGYEQQPAPNMRILGVAVVACVLGAILMVAYYIKRERML